MGTLNRKTMLSNCRWYLIMTCFLSAAYQWGVSGYRYSVLAQVVQISKRVDYPLR